MLCTWIQPCCCYGCYCRGNRHLHKLERFWDASFTNWVNKMPSIILGQKCDFNEEQLIHRVDGKMNERYLFPASHYTNRKLIMQKECPPPISTNSSIELREVVDQDIEMKEQVPNVNHEMSSEEKSFDDMYRPFILHLTRYSYITPLLNRQSPQYDAFLDAHVSMDRQQWDLAERTREQQFIKQFPQLRDSHDYKQQQRALREVLNGPATLLHEPSGHVNESTIPVRQITWNTKFWMEDPSNPRQYASLNQWRKQQDSLQEQWKQQWKLLEAQHQTNLQSWEDDMKKMAKEQIEQTDIHQQLIQFQTTHQTAKDQKNQENKTELTNSKTQYYKNHPNDTQGWKVAKKQIEQTNEQEMQKWEMAQKGIEQQIQDKVSKLEADALDAAKRTHAQKLQQYEEQYEQQKKELQTQQQQERSQLEEQKKLIDKQIQHDTQWKLIIIRMRVLLMRWPTTDSPLYPHYRMLLHHRSGKNGGFVESKNDGSIPLIYEGISIPIDEFYVPRTKSQVDTFCTLGMKLLSLKKDIQQFGSSLFKISLY